MALTAICAKIRSPIFSIKNPEAFQVGITLPIPQPSTLVGALAYCIGVHREIGLKALNIARDMILAARATIESPAVVVSPVILRRFRILDKGFEAKVSKAVPPFKRFLDLISQGLIDEARKIIEVELTDALYREYVTSAIFKCVWILSEEVKPEALYLIQRLGDTESLCTVVEVWEASCKKIEIKVVETKYPLPHYGEDLVNVEGSYLYIKMCDEHRTLKGYIIPCERKMHSTRKGIRFIAYTPSTVKIRYSIPHEVFDVDGELIVR
ncbi:MAG: type I-A CRISPR-associated protein Cas5a [archaeon GB-1867-005]|nr:type I-A CRISPR-associated protein Cas5a [Candidatus Culexmicrobium cathedralense]